MSKLQKVSKIVKNRRLKFIKFFIRKDYFSLEEIKLRDPHRYHLFVGQYSTKEDREAPFEDNIKLVDRIYHNIDEKTYVDSIGQQLNDESVDAAITISVEEKQDFADELVEIMKRRFLDGLDDFDYTLIDNDPEFDDYDVLEKDLLERYFDSEEASPLNDISSSPILEYDY